MNIFIFLFYSIPEEFLIVALCSALAGYNISNNKARYVFVSLFLAFSIELLRIVDFSIPLRLIIQFLVFIALMHWGMKIAFQPLIVCSVTTLLLLQINEFFIINLFIELFHKNLQEIQSSTWLFLTYDWSILFIIFMLIYFIKKYNFSLFQPYVQFNTISSRSYLVFLTCYVISIIGATLLGNGEIGLDYAFIAFSILQMLSLLIIYELVKSHRRETQLAVYKESLKQITSLFTTIRAQRHDFSNHIQVIYILVKQQEYEKLLHYVEQLAGEIKSINKVLISDNPGLSALLQVKTAQFRQENIALRLDLQASLTDLKIPLIEINQMIGNLLDNAADAIKLAGYPSNEIFLQTLKVGDKVQIKVKNYRPVIPFHLQRKIFEYGFSTKPDHSGLGLAIVSNLVERNKGTIHLVSNDETGTEFSITFQEKGMMKNEQKTG
jgi:two-component system sensor histidine kinase AgrC